jgi:hypothetical protein
MFCIPSGGRCESVRKIIERVFGMLKNRFRILRLPMLVQDMSEVEDMVKVCCVLHNMCLQVCVYIYKGSSTTWTQCTWAMTGPPFLLGMSS